MGDKRRVSKKLFSLAFIGLFAAASVALYAGLMKLFVAILEEIGK